MKINKIFLLLGSLAASVLGTSCVDEVEYTPAEPAPVTEYYFPTVQNYNNDLVDGDNSIKVYIARANSKGEATVNFTHEISPAGKFEIPTSVTFADGVGTASFDIQFDLNDIEVNQEYKITLQIPGIEDTPYSLGKIEITALYLPWRDFEENNSMGIYTDATVGPLYGGPAETYEVKFQKHPTIDGIYRIVNPYGEAWPLYGVLDYDNSKDHYMVIDARNPNQVLVKGFDTGISDGEDGNLWVYSYADYAMEFLGVTETVVTNNKLWAILNNGIIKFDESSSLLRQCMVGYFPQTKAGPYIGNSGNTFKIILPGYEDEPEWEEYGMCNFTDGLLGPWFGILDNTYPVLVEHSLLDKDLYRIVNPYGPNSGYADEEPDAPEYIQFSIADPDFVTIGEFFIGLYMDQAKTKALYYVTSMADYAMIYQKMSPAEAKNAGYGATYSDKVLTLPAENCVGVILDVATDKLSMGMPAKACNMVLDMNNPTPMNPEGDAESQAKKNVVKLQSKKALNKRIGIRANSL